MSFSGCEGHSKSFIGGSCSHHHRLPATQQGQWARGRGSQARLCGCRALLLTPGFLSCLLGAGPRHDNSLVKESVLLPKAVVQKDCAQTQPVLGVSVLPSTFPSHGQKKTMF